MGLLPGRRPGSAAAPGAVQRALCSQGSADPPSSSPPALRPCPRCAWEAGGGPAWHRGALPTGRHSEQAEELLNSDVDGGGSCTNSTF